MTSCPKAGVRRVTISDDLRRELERRLVVVFLGGGHRSSAIHRRVIERLEGLGPDCRELQLMRQCEADAVRAMTA